MRYKKGFKKLQDENQKLLADQNVLKKVVAEQQNFLETLRNDRTKNNLFISGIPMEAEINGTNMADPKAMQNHILKFVHPGIKAEDFRIIKNFEPREGHTRHSMKVLVNDLGAKKKIFEGCKTFKDVNAGSPLKTISKTKFDHT